MPVIRGNHLNKINEFYGNLLTSVQALESMGKLAEINGLTRATLDKLEVLKSILVLLYKTWQYWRFPNFVGALKDWTQRNPINPDCWGVQVQIILMEILSDKFDVKTPFKLSSLNGSVSHVLIGKI